MEPCLGVRGRICLERCCVLTASSWAGASDEGVLVLRCVLAYDLLHGMSYDRSPAGLYEGEYITTLNIAV